MGSGILAVDFNDDGNLDRVFAGNRLIYAAARSNGDVFNSGWQAVGSRTVQ